MICFALFRLNVKLGTCQNKFGYYGRLLFFILLIAELSVLYYLTLFELLWFLQYVAIYVQVYTLVLDLPLKAHSYRAFRCSMWLFGPVFVKRCAEIPFKNAWWSLQQCRQLVDIVKGIIRNSCNGSTFLPAALKSQSGPKTQMALNRSGSLGP